ncbi:MAG: asparagine--tRNA ligase [Candidatus Eisenbacteria bacterium]|nr:asparagine--tRNA ligase [Candidatus Eisenbacteria bacterium]
MHQRHTIESIAEHVGQEITLEGWLAARRSSGKIQFLQVRDGTGFIQCVVSVSDVGEDVFERVSGLTQESSVRVTGVVRADERAPTGFELSATGVEVVSLADEYPITPKEHGTSFLMDHRHLWIRSSRQFAALRVRATVMREARRYFDERGYLLLDTPILTPSACEGTTTLFETEYFGEKAYLTQSGQLYNEATAMAFGRVYCCGPSLRAEKAKTRRHLIEFWQIEPEMAYADLDDVMEVAEELVTWVVAAVLRERRYELSILDRDAAPLERIEPPFPRLTYDQAVERLREKASDFNWGDDFGAEEETLLSELFDRPVLVHRYPRSVKPFYMENDPDDDRLSLSVDMLAPEGYGEIVGGGQRLTDPVELKRRMDEEGMSEEDYGWYLDLRKYGSVPHGGFGMGIERVVTWICGLPHLRETIPFPRMLSRLRP